METKTIEHKLQKITIEYGYNNNPWTEEDEELVQALVKMYDHEVAMDEKFEKMMSEYFAAKKTTDTLREKLNQLAETIENIREEADGFREHFGLAVPQSFIDFSFQVADIGKLISEFDVPFRKHDRKMEKLRKLLNRLTTESEEDYVFWDEYSEVQFRHSDHSEANSIDIVKFDYADEMLRAVESVHGDRRNGHRERCREYYDDYKLLVSEVTVQYKVWDEFLKRFMLLGYIFGQKTMLPGVWEN